MMKLSLVCIVSSLYSLPSVQGLSSEELSQRLTVAANWIDDEFQPSSLTRDEQISEMEWFIKAAEPYQALEIKVVSEILDTHAYESDVLANAFFDMTGIRVNHELIDEGDVVNTLLLEATTGESFYDAYVTDSDLIGMLFRYDFVFPIGDYFDGEGKNITSPTLDIEDFIGRYFVTAPDAKIYQLPDQQFPNLYWFRYDWFSDDEIKAQFKEIYGYDLGVPLNWKAYEDIADFFTNKVNGDGTIDGTKVYGHNDYGADHASLSWRFTDAWLVMAGAGSEGTPNGLPVDDWGIRSRIQSALGSNDLGCEPVGSSVTRGGSLNAPASVYALEKYLLWLNEYAPPEARNLTVLESGPLVGEGNIAQQIFWYTPFITSMTDAVKDSDGSPKWRVAPSPHGIYWREGMKLGYQDCGSWTLMRNTDPERRAAAWLYAQFVTSKTVSLKKSIVGTTFIRESDLQTDYLTENADQFAGLIEFYRSSARLLYTPTGSNVPNYAAQTPLWKAHIAPAVHGNLTAQEALDNLATAQDDLMVQLAATGDMLRCIPKLNPEREPEFWLEAFPGAPYPKLADEEGVPSTMSYDELIKAWTAVPDEPSIDDGTSDALTMTFSLMLLLLSSWCVFGWQCS